MARKHFSQKQKLSILRSAEQTTVKDAANIAEVHFTTVNDWKKQFEVMGEQGYLEYQVPRPGRGIKKISPEKGQAVVDCWYQQNVFTVRVKKFFQIFTRMLEEEKNISLSSKQWEIS